MKVFLFFLMLLYTNSSYSQPVKKEPLMLLKEDLSVDSLFDEILKQDISGQKYFSLISIGTKPNLILNVQPLKKHPVESGFYFYWSDSITHTGYFKYKGYTIFVGQAGSPIGHFNVANAKKSFYFMTDYMGSDDVSPAIYQYKKGKFIAD